VHFRDGGRHVHVSEIGVLRFGRVLFEIDNVMVILIKIFFAEVVDDRLAVLLLLMRALMLSEVVRS